MTGQKRTFEDQNHKAKSYGAIHIMLNKFPSWPKITREHEPDKIVNLESGETSHLTVYLPKTNTLNNNNRKKTHRNEVAVHKLKSF